MNNKVISGLLNPLRMKIFQILLTNQTATARCIAEELPDIPPASLYRHINKLVADEILEVCAENKIRGTVEKVYRLKNNPLLELNEVLKSKNPDDLFNVFYTFAMSLLSDFQDYLATGDYELEKDKVGFRSYPLYLSDEECDEFFNDLKKTLNKVQGKRVGDEKRLRKFSFVMMPVDPE